MKSIDYTAYSELIKDLIRDTTKSKSTKISNKLSGVNANLRTHFIDTIEKNNSYTRDANHTQKIKHLDNEVVSVENLFLDLYAIIFI